MPHRERASVICVIERKLLVIRLQDPDSQRQYFFPPGGAIEAGETPAQAAERETLEETGYAVKVDPASQNIAHYPFVWDGTVYDCTTYFFKATLLSTTAQPVQDVTNHLGVSWLPVAEVSAAFAYHQALQTAILKLL